MAYCRHFWMKSFKIVTGDKGEGKTNFLLSHFHDYKGIVSIHRGEEYYLRDMEMKKEELLLSRNPFSPYKWKNWYINQDAFSFANEKLLSYYGMKVMVDEVGVMEMEGKGFSPFLQEAGKMDLDLVIAVRKDYIDMVRERFFPSLEPTIISVGKAL